MRRLLRILPRPSRYAGIEEGIVHKNPDAVRLRIALAFPDLYEVGMSYLGQKILYGLVNAQADWQAERVFAPCVESGAILKGLHEPLCSLESDTPLALFDFIGFSLTHELCYTNVLYMLDLAGLPFHSKDRYGLPIVAAGGGCTLAAEPMAPFFDLMFLGDGEESLPEFLRLLQQAKDSRKDKPWILEQAARLPGIYVPGFFRSCSGRLPPEPLRSGYTEITRRAVPDLNDAYYPLEQVTPFGAVHNRLTLEIARGCTRGCRFCQAGIVGRPARERNVAKLQDLLGNCLNSTGYDDVSLLSLSTGDFSALKTFFTSAVKHCAAEQIALSLPSLRAGSIDDSIMEGMAGIRRTGATLAPEAGSQRLRDVINKGVTEDEIILHVRKLFEYGWQHLKLYFMIGLPTENDDDLLAIVELCRKARDAAGPGIKRMQVTAAVSPFVPKPHTPFQWEQQLSLEETRRRIKLLQDAFKPEKRLKLRWHNPEMSFLEGVFSRGDRHLAPVVQKAYAKGAVFSSWTDHFKLAPWLEALAEEGLEPGTYLSALDINAPLPWAHLRSGVQEKFLRLERERAFMGSLSPDCRYNSCLNCGVCDRPSAASSLSGGKAGAVYMNRLNFPQRDQQPQQARLDEYGRVITRAQPEKAHKNQPPALAASLSGKVEHYQIFYAKTGAATSLSQLEIQAVFERAMRQGALPLAFSRGFKPAPLISFARALPVGVASLEEWCALYLRERAPAERVRAAFDRLPDGLRVTAARKIALELRPRDALQEIYRLEWSGEGASRRNDFLQACAVLPTLPGLPWTKEGKNGARQVDLRAHIRSLDAGSPGVYTALLDWSHVYVSPLFLFRAALGLSLNGNADYFSAHEFLLTKLSAAQ